MESQETNQENLEKTLTDQGDKMTEQYAPVAAPVEYAGFWVRFAAQLIDGLVLIVPSAMVQGLVGKEYGSFFPTVLMWIYAVYMLIAHQATLGKMAVGLKVTTENGEKPTDGKFILREVVGKTLNVFTLFIGYLMIVFTKKKQGLHDKIAGTVVVYDPTRKKRSWLVMLIGGLFFIIPILGMLAAIVLVSTNSARQKAIQEKVRLEQEAKKIEQQLKENDAKGKDDAVYCTQDAKECPDGSFIGRVAPSCEFAPCPQR